MLGKIHANLNYHIHTTKATSSKKMRHHHAHIHTQDQFTWVPPLIAQSDEDLAGPEAISLDEIDALFSAFESEVAEGEGHESVSGRGVVEGQVYSFEELDQVDKGLLPKVVNHSQQDDGGWDATLLMLSNDLDCL
ncbi:hypothetical protein BKA82DRAFT_4217061 [Pisolithus tinctorius]|nr:hypothetical protein BKA82DRAFT_4217061 [Pisolithus tinctorius]